jgi:phosphatidylglycerol:prolipoprotein diacylglycerol transferase
MRAPAGTLLAVAFGVPDPSRTVHLGPIEFRYGNAPHFDLGLLEMLFTCIIAGFFALTWRKKLPTGSYIAAVALAYSPVRFVMDFLRLREGESSDPRYGQLTPAQWACIALFTFGLVMVAVIRRNIQAGVDPLDKVTLQPEKEPEQASPASVTEA